MANLDKYLLNNLRNGHLFSKQLILKVFSFLVKHYLHVFGFKKIIYVLFENIFCI